MRRGGRNCRARRLLNDRGAELRVAYLPSGEHDGKTGLDDFLFAGPSRDDLLALAVDELRPLAGATTTKVMPSQQAPLPVSARSLLS